MSPYLYTVDARVDVARHADSIVFVSWRLGARQNHRPGDGRQLVGVGCEVEPIRGRRRARLLISVLSVT